MKLGNLERKYIQSPLRRWLHQPFITHYFARKYAFPEGKILEIGCANGHGLRLIHKKQPNAALYGVEIDDDLLKDAEPYLAAHDIPANIQQGDAADMPFDDAMFAAVVNFGVIHHVPDWPVAVREALRVLKPGGVFYVEEYYQPLLEHKFVQKHLPHPKQRFSHTAFWDCVAQNGAKPLVTWHFFGLFGGGIAIKQQD